MDTRVRGFSVSANFQKWYVRTGVRDRHFKLFHVRDYIFYDVRVRRQGRTKMSLSTEL